MYATVQELVDALTPEEKIGQLFIIRPDALDLTLPQETINDAKADGVTMLTDAMRETLQAYPVGGICQFGKNITDPEQLALGPSAVLHGVADHVVDTYLEVTEAIQDDIDEIEAEVFEPRTKIDAEQIYLMKREVMELRRAVMPLARPLQRLAEGYTPAVPEEVRSYFRNVEDHLTTVSERVAGFDELLTTLVDATLAKITLQQNTDMRKISAWVAIISTPTMIAGIYGMNFKVMPELDLKFGYPMTLLVMLISCIVLFKIFRRNKWL